jgi:DUF1680 family protein
VIRTRGYKAETDVKGNVTVVDTAELTLIPYHLWNNRGKGDMRVWIPHLQPDQTDMRE